jgi:hypothetical protein
VAHRPRGCPGPNLMNSIAGQIAARYATHCGLSNRSVARPGILWAAARLRPRRRLPRQIPWSGSRPWVTSSLPHWPWHARSTATGWKHGDVHDEQRKTHPNLIDWHAIEANPALLNPALTSLAETLSQLRELGYRSAPGWERYRRVGIVTAEQRQQPWTWTTDTGYEMQARPGDWVVQDAEAHRWSVRDDIFRATHEHIDGPRWRRAGFVLARASRPGERIDTLEGATTASEEGWVVKGEQGEHWPVSAEEFARRYEGPVE